MPPSAHLSDDVLCNPVSAILRNADNDPAAVAVRGPITPNRLVLTRREFVDAIACAGDRLTRAGLHTGDRMVLIAPTCAEFLVEFFAAQALGLVVVAANPLSTERELRYFLDDSGARLVLAHPQCSAAGQAAAEAEDVGFELIRPLTGHRAASPPLVPVPRRDDDLAALLYTSGTTGTPKGAMITVGNLLTAAAVGKQISGITEQDRSGTALPLFHVFGLSSVAMVTLSAGAALTLLPRFDAGQLLETIVSDQLTVVAGVPTMWNALTHSAGQTVTTPHLRLALSGGAAISLQLMRTFNAQFDARITEGYGLTETCAFGTLNPGTSEDTIGSVGLPVPSMEVRIADPISGTACRTGETGEVLMRGPLVMRGYWKRPEDTAAAFVDDGFFRTGDLGYLDAHGYLYIVDRLKDLIIHGGYNVYPREVEEVLYAHPQVFEAAVIGAADEHYGQQVAAVVTPMPGAELTGDEIEAWCRQSLSAYKIPRIIRIVDGLPKGPTGKIRKRSIEL
ncbi:class I adenylate-forming enzyme family protein [Brevibacterium luteolum]|uniref:class I adenylate-forming enzyme family protein n=1 Tax=Brevibacterium luteolum TaxID=199591 RepID=UPI003879A581